MTKYEALTGVKREFQIFSFDKNGNIDFITYLMDILRMAEWIQDEYDAKADAIVWSE